MDKRIKDYAAFGVAMYAIDRLASRTPRPHLYRTIFLAFFLFMVLAGILTVIHYLPFLLITGVIGVTGYGLGHNHGAKHAIQQIRNSTPYRPQHSNNVESEVLYSTHPRTQEPENDLKEDLKNRPRSGVHPLFPDD